MVLLSGEPGIGKSRATMKLADFISQEPHTRLKYQCSPFHINSPLYPVVANLQHAARIELTDSADEKLDKLEALLNTPAKNTATIMPLFADLLSIPSGERYAPLGLTPQRQKEKTLETLVARLEQLAQSNPVLMLFEDLHWIDPTTQELLDTSIPAVKSLKILLIATFRPEYVSPWIGQPNTTLLQLSRLSEREGAEIVRNVAGAQTLSDDYVAAIVNRTDGVPLFLEDLARSIIDDGDNASSVPTSNQASLLARLDRLGPAKELAQVGSVLGRDFSYELLRLARGKDESVLHQQLERLISSGLLLARGIPPNSSYQFKHALVQDAAYDSLLRAKRQSLHQKIAGVLEQRFATTAAAHPELPAHHRSQARDHEQAIQY